MLNALPPTFFKQPKISEGESRYIFSIVCVCVCAYILYVWLPECMCVCVCVCVCMCVCVCVCVRGPFFTHLAYMKEFLETSQTLFTE